MRPAIRLELALVLGLILGLALALPSPSSAESTGQWELVKITGETVNQWGTEDPKRTWSAKQGEVIGSLPSRGLQDSVRWTPPPSTANAGDIRQMTVELSSTCTSAPGVSNVPPILFSAFFRDPRPSDDSQVAMQLPCDQALLRQNVQLRFPKPEVVGYAMQLVIAADMPEGREWYHYLYEWSDSGTSTPTAQTTAQATPQATEQPMPPAVPATPEATPSPTSIPSASATPPPTATAQTASVPTPSPTPIAPTGATFATETAPSATPQPATVIPTAGPPRGEPSFEPGVISLSANLAEELPGGSDGPLASAIKGLPGGTDLLCGVPFVAGAGIVLALVLFGIVRAGGGEQREPASRKPGPGTRTAAPTTARPTPATTRTWWTCARCGAANVAALKTCARCGAQRGSVWSASNTATNRPPSKAGKATTCRAGQSARFCGQCGAKIAATARFCDRCGARA